MWAVDTLIFQVEIHALKNNQNRQEYTSQFLQFFAYLLNVMSSILL